MATETPDLPLSADDYFDHLLADLAAISAIPHSGLDDAVAACPGWTVTDAVVHLGGVLAATAARVVTPDGERPDVEGPGERSALDYFSESAAALVGAFETTDPEDLRPNWSDDDRAFFFWRRMTHETLIHRWDIESAVGDAAPIDPLMAMDGLAELVGVILPASRQRLGLPCDGTTVHFHATDEEAGDTLPAGEWMVTFGADEIEVEAAHDKGDFAFRGRAADLLLFAWNRSTAGVDAFGDGDPLAWWSAHVTI